MADNFLLIIYREGEEHSHRNSLFIQETTKPHPIIKDMVNYEFLNRKTIGFSPLYTLYLFINGKSESNPQLAPYEHDLFNMISSSVSSRLLTRIEEAEELDQKQKNELQSKQEYDLYQKLKEKFEGTA